MAQKNRGLKAIPVAWTYFMEAFFSIFDKKKKKKHSSVFFLIFGHQNPASGYGFT
jgi:hypothetical protein